MLVAHLYYLLVIRNSKAQVFGKLLSFVSYTFLRSFSDIQAIRLFVSLTSCTYLCCIAKGISNKKGW